MKLPVLALAVALLTTSALAATVDVTGYQMTVADPVIVLVNGQSAYAGMVTLDTTTSPLLVWCELNAWADERASEREDRT